MKSNRKIDLRVQYVITLQVLIKNNKNKRKIKDVVVFLVSRKLHSNNNKNKIL